MALDAGALAADLWRGSVPPGVRDAAREVLDRATRLRRAWWRFFGHRRLIRDLAVIEHAVRAIDDGDVELRDVERLLITHLADELDVRVGERVAGYRCHLTLSVGEDQRILLVADSGQPDAAARIRDLTRDHIAQASGAEVLRIPAWLIRYAPEAIGDVVEGVLSGRPATPATEHAHFTRRPGSGPRSG